MPALIALIAQVISKAQQANNPDDQNLNSGQLAGTVASLFGSHRTNNNHALNLRDRGFPASSQGW